jgi:hypothetical protein
MGWPGAGAGVLEVDILGSFSLICYAKYNTGTRRFASATCLFGLPIFNYHLPITVSRSNW